MFQLIDEHVFVCQPPKKGNGAICWDKTKFVNEFGFLPTNVIDYKSLKGDPSDNIPGVYGIGDKTARKLIQKYKTLDNLYNNIDNVTPKSLRDKLIKSKKDAFLSHELATIDTSIPFDISKPDLKWENKYTQEFIDKLKQYKFKSLINRYFNSKISKVDKKETQLSLI